MFTLPWTTVSRPDPATECSVLAVRLPLRLHRDMPRFLWWALRVKGQLATSPGLLGYALAAQVTNKTFWTVSAWTRRGELARFDRTDPHRAAKRRLGPVMLPSTLVVWTCHAGDLPIGWEEIRRRIAQARP